MKHIRVYFDFTCPYCYHEWANLRLLRQQGTDLDIEWYGWEIHPELQGLPATPFAFDESHKKSFAELGKATGVNAGNLSVLASSHDALRLLEEAAKQGLADAWVDRVFSAVYDDGQAMNDPQNLLAWANDIGLSHAADVLHSDQYRDILLIHDRHCTQIALEYIPAIEQNGVIIATGILTYEHTRQVLA